MYGYVLKHDPSRLHETLHRSAMVLILFAREAKESEWKTLNSLLILRKIENKIISNIEMY